MFAAPPSCSARALRPVCLGFELDRANLEARIRGGAAAPGKTSPQ